MTERQDGGMIGYVVVVRGLIEEESTKQVVPILLSRRFILQHIQDDTYVIIMDMVIYAAAFNYDVYNGDGLLRCCFRYSHPLKSCEGHLAGVIELRENVPS